MSKLVPWAGKSHPKAVRYMPALEVTPAERTYARRSELYKIGDMVLVWVNEGDLFGHDRTAPPSTAQPAAPVPEDCLDKLAAMGLQFPPREAPAVVAPLSLEQANFEMRFNPGFPTSDFDKAPDGQYIYDFTRLRWEGWQARVAIESKDEGIQRDAQNTWLQVNPQVFADVVNVMQAGGRELSKSFLPSIAKMGEKLEQEALYLSSLLRLAVARGTSPPKEESTMCGNEGQCGADTTPVLEVAGFVNENDLAELGRVGAADFTFERSGYRQVPLYAARLDTSSDTPNVEVSTKPVQTSDNVSTFSGHAGHFLTREGRKVFAKSRTAQDEAYSAWTVQDVLTEVKRRLELMRNDADKHQQGYAWALEMISIVEKAHPPAHDGQTFKCAVCAINAPEQALEALAAESQARGEYDDATPTPTERGPWVYHPRSIEDGKRIDAYLESDDFTHDVRLYINGDFGSDAQCDTYGRMIAERLNSFAALRKSK